MDEGRRGGLRRALAVAVAVSIALAVVACGGGSNSPVTAGDKAYQVAAAYARCMRSHGALNWPDPNSQGQFLKTAANRANFQAPESAYKACQHLLPNGGQLTVAEQEKIAPLMLKFTACMRSHGITNFPDPIVNSQGVGVLPPRGLDIHSPQFQAVQRACRKYMQEAGKYIPPG